MSLILAACSTTASKSPRGSLAGNSGSVTLATEHSALSFGEIRVQFVPGRDREVITVSTLDRVAIKSAVLVMPGSIRVAASDIDTEQDPFVDGGATSAALAYRPNYSLATPGGPQPIQGFPQATTTALGQTKSVAEIHIPNMDAYRRSWTKAHIEIVEGDGFAEPTVLAAPAPR